MLGTLSPALRFNFKGRVLIDAPFVVLMPMGRPELVAQSYIELFVALVSSGQLTPRLWHLRAGDRLWLNPKIKGVFTLDVIPPDCDVIMIATGTGLAPYMSMLRSHLECNGARRMAILLGARQSWDLGYRPSYFQSPACAAIFHCCR